MPPDHKEGWFQHGAAPVRQRLQTSFDTLKQYFEEQLGLEARHWVALLGAHTVGHVAGLDPHFSKTLKDPFDNTPETFDNLYFQNLDLFHISGMTSLCPQARRPGNAHWWGMKSNDVIQHPGHGDFIVLLDPDVSLTVDTEVQAVVREYAVNQQVFFDNFVTSYLQMSELGHSSAKLHDDDGDDDDDDTTTRTFTSTTTTTMTTFTRTIAITITTTTTTNPASLTTARNFATASAMTGTTTTTSNAPARKMAIATKSTASRTTTATATITATKTTTTRTAAITFTTTTITPSSFTTTWKTTSATTGAMTGTTTTATTFAASTLATATTTTTPLQVP
eukprot:TRINITY_DN21548_c0_g1_i6.p1 TRINITY_DN21548_c0_g1~~TRINITY_DN21548_c0_g1_i6.p1  ORF type:complete len:360 (-),score=37.75 TRINITY_DN21548_c0_g1_i6:828-1835(-)